MKRLLFIPLLALPLLFMSCDSPTGDAEQATLLEPPTISADVTIAGGPGEGDFTSAVKYKWPTCLTTATPDNGDWELARGPDAFNICLYAHVTSADGNVTRGQVVWEQCLEYRDGVSRPKEDCASGSGVWQKLGGQGGGTKVDEDGEALWGALRVPDNNSCPGGLQVGPFGYRYKFKGGGQVKAGTSAPFNVTVPACPS